MRKSALALTLAAVAACDRLPEFETPSAALNTAYSVGDAGQSITASQAEVGGYTSVQLTITDAEKPGDVALVRNAVTYACGDETGPLDSVEALANKFIAYAAETSVEDRLKELDALQTFIETEWNPALCHDI